MTGQPLCLGRGRQGPGEQPAARPESLARRGRGQRQAQKDRTRERSRKRRPAGQKWKAEQAAGGLGDCDSRVPPRSGNPGLGAGPDDSWPLAPSSPLSMGPQGAWLARPFPGTSHCPIVCRPSAEKPLAASPDWRERGPAATSPAAPLRPVPGSRQTGRETEEAGGGQRESSHPACRPARWPLSKASGLEVPCTSPPCRPPPQPRLALSPGPSHSREATLKGDCAVSRRRPSRVAAQPHQTPRHPSLTSLYCPHPTNSCLIFGLSSGYPKTPADVPQ